MRCRGEFSLEGATFFARPVVGAARAEHARHRLDFVGIMEGPRCACDLASTRRDDMTSSCTVTLTLLDFRLRVPDMLIAAVAYWCYSVQVLKILLTSSTRNHSRRK